MLKLIYEDDNYIISIESKEPSHHISEPVNMMRQALLAASFSEKLVDEYIPYSWE